MTRLRDLPQPARFLLAGGLAALVNWLARFPLSWLVPYGLAVVGAACIGMAFGFVAYRAYVFRDAGPGGLRQVPDFLLVNAVTTVLVTLVALSGRDLLTLVGTPCGRAEAIAHASGIAAGAVGNYFGHAAITFRTRRPVAAEG
ncbi:GtrA family protein [Methylobacterium radiodurans]|uniref:GtrA/DPMS transmembrane domain-containing protein n=1 Tax=Methylobacterium radiodurans TaxID=2202828 RepID=A0A2U8VRD5_9HYPH|nr:GtrA family protein [Methylobacterium radiodurans]AWN36253.1 hypothetical protein DK427_11410 [Methylobacterium radiodurans]